MYQKTKSRIKSAVDTVKEYIKINDVIAILAGVLSGRTFLLYNLSPFGIACITAYIMKKYYSMVCLLPMLGVLCSGRGQYGIKYIIVYFLMGIVSFFQDKFKNKKILYGACFGAVILGNILYFLLSEGTLYDFIVLGLECVFAYFLADSYLVFFSYFESAKIRRTMTKRELYSLSAVFLVMLASVADIKLVFDITVSGVIADFVILFTAIEFSTGVCAVSGVMTGAVMGVANPQMLYCVGSYGISAVFASLGSKYKKLGAICAFILSNAFFTFYANNSSYMLVNVFEVMLAGVVISIIPSHKLDEVKNNILMLLPGAKAREARRVEIVKYSAGTRMKKLSTVFEKMAEVITKNNKKPILSKEKEEKMLVENVAQRVCKTCRNSKKCWVDEYQNTYKVVSGLLKATSLRGWAENYDVPPQFKNVCYNPSALVLETNKVYELYRVNAVWESKVSESRKLINQQLCDVSEVVKNIASEIENGYSFEIEAEEKIIEMLDDLGVKVKNVAVMKEKEERYQVSVSVADCKKDNTCRFLIAPVAEKVLKRRFYPENKNCNSSNCTIKLIEREWFEAEVGISRIRQKGEKEWGDSYAIIRPGNGKIIVALSDGMGSGSEAAKESNETVRLLEGMLVAGIDKETAVKLINSVLILKSYDENFATIDMLVFDLYTGVGEFIKTGSAGSYIKKGKKVVCLRSASLPTGIVGTLEPAKSRMRFVKGDIIIIASDGVTEVIRDDSWIREVLKNLQEQSAQEISELLMSKALKLQTEHTDDMTVIAVKIKEK